MNFDFRSLSFSSCFSAIACGALCVVFSAFDARAAERAFDINVFSDNEEVKKLVSDFTVLKDYQAISNMDLSEYEQLIDIAKNDTAKLLATKGFFSPDIKVSHSNGAVNINISAGVLSRINDVNISFEGDILDKNNSDNASQMELIRSNWALNKGAGFSQSAWDGAKTDALRELVINRFPLGAISFSRADVVSRDNLVNLSVRFNSGSLFRYGSFVVNGASRYPSFLPQRLSWIKEGDFYNQKDLVKTQERLMSSGYYSAAYVSVKTDDVDNPLNAPVIFNVTEAKRHRLQAGFGFSTDGGARATFNWRDNSFLGSNWRMDSTLNFDKRAPLAQFEFNSLPNENFWKSTGLVRFMREDDGELVTTSQSLRFGRMKSEEHYDKHFFIKYDHASVKSSVSSSTNVTNALLGDGSALSANYAWTGRYFDDYAMPKKGYGIVTEIGAGLTTTPPIKPFVSLQGKIVNIVPLSAFLSGDSRLSMRVAGGAVLADKTARLPATYLFRTGGDTSVRGYSYRSIGVDLGDGIIAPARYMYAASIEWQRPIFKKRFNSMLEHTFFVDVGSAAQNLKSMRANWGVGTGIRLLTPIGPMGLDLAYGLHSKKWRLHMTVGFQL